MMTYEEFYDEKLLPVYARLKEHAQRKSDGYAKLHEDFRNNWEKMQRRKGEIRANCAQQNQLLEKMIHELREDLSPEADAKKLELSNRQSQNKLDAREEMARIDTDLHRLAQDYRNAKVQHCITTNAEEQALYSLVHARKKDFEHLHHLQRVERFSPLKRWIYRRFFAKKGGAL